MEASKFVVLVLAALVLPFAAFAQSVWPNEPVTFIVPYPPAGLNGAVARVMGDRLTATRSMATAPR